ncbi:MAG: EAL domain-containing protein, partial [Sphingomonas bacterium]|nr:EAL domain-containing protein [Sphingomonas bacterium]
MQAAASRSAAPNGARDAAHDGPPEPRLGADDSALLAALPIAAAIVGLTSKGILKLIERNCRFDEVIAQTNNAGMIGGDFGHCVHLQIAQLMSDFLADANAPSELDFCDSEGIGARHFRIKLAPLQRDPVRDRPRCLICLVDRTVEVRAELSLRAEMLRDSLTGLPNRLSFSESIEAAGTISPGQIGRPRIDHAVLVVDMRRFSRINESMGSLAGDELLITFARRLISALRAGDILARTGGNEFGVLVGLKRGVDDALAAAERIQQVMTAPFKLSELEIRVECAIGVALMDVGQDSEELFRHAQFAVKQAKLAGKPQVYEPKEASAARRRFSIETELRRALDKDQLKLFYQPLIDLKSGQVAGFEALARWTHDDRGEISPTEFIPVAEESGLILTLGRWAMDKAAQTLSRWDREEGGPLPLYVAVNLSAIQVARDNIAEVVESALKATGLAGNRLTLELTESSIVQDPGRAQRLFEALKALDATVAMDDFGTGYSSLAYL